MGAFSGCSKKNILLTKNIWLVLYLAIVLLATVGPFVVLRLGKDSWMDYFLDCLPFFIPTFFLSGWCIQFVTDSFPTTILVEIVYYLLWFIVVISAIRALRSKQVWKYVPYLLFTTDALVNLIVPHIAAVVDFTMIVLYALMLKKSDMGHGCKG